MLAQERGGGLRRAGLGELAASPELDGLALEPELAVRVLGGVLARELQRTAGLAASP